MLALILCHNVTPVFFSTKEFQASSPDEVAIVKFAESLGIKLDQREQDSISITFLG